MSIRAQIKPLAVASLFVALATSIGVSKETMNGHIDFVLEQLPAVADEVVDTAVKSGLKEDIAAGLRKRIEARVADCK